MLCRGLAKTEYFSEPGRPYQDARQRFQNIWCPGNDRSVGNSIHQLTTLICQSDSTFLKVTVCVYFNRNEPRWWPSSHFYGNESNVFKNWTASRLLQKWQTIRLSWTDLIHTWCCLETLKNKRVWQCYWRTNTETKEYFIHYTQTRVPYPFPT